MNTITILSIVLPFCGIVIGGVLTFIFQKKINKKNQQETLKMNAYTDFIKAASGVAIAQKLGDLKMKNEYLFLLTDAKARICIYGNDNVIEELASFDRLGANLGNKDCQKVFIEIIKQMRSDNKKTNINSNDLSMIMLGC